MDSKLLFLSIFGTLSMAAPLIAAALGGLFSERSGVVNIGLEGMMTFGAFSGAVGAFFAESFDMGQSSLLIGLICAMLGGALFGLMHAYLSISLKVDQVISGTAINIITLGFALYLTNIMFATKETPVLQTRPIDFFGGKLTLLTILIFASAFLVYFLIYKTRWGLRVLAVGENPQAADAMGINVIKVRYQAVIMSGVFAGIAGMSIIVNTASRFSGNAVAGAGFIALAVLIFGRHNPFGVIFAGLVFGFTKNLSVIVRVVSPDMPTVFLDILPYIATIVVLIIFSRNKIMSMEALGKPYDKEMR